jgi:acyl-homoserine-lactone acylase
MKKILLSVCLVPLSIALLISDAAQSPAEETPHGEVLWDTFGVPHVYGKNEAGVFYGFGWAQAQSHGNIVLHLYGEARGRAAEYWGEKYVESDRWVVTNSIYERAGEWYKEQTPQFRADLDAFANGINAYAAKHPDQIDPAVKAVLPVTGVDVMAHAERLVQYIYVAPAERVLHPRPSSEESAGSNAWAVAPSKSASGNTMVVSNPHLPWPTGYFTYYEAQLEGPGIDMYGATQVGLPILRFCFNNEHSFTNTVNTTLGATTYKLTLAEGGYLFDGKVLPFQTSEKTIRVKQPDGELKDVKITIRKTVQGPVFVQPDNTTVALRVAALDRPGMLQAYWDMGLAKNFAEYKAALDRDQIATFNIVYGDRQGHIMYEDNAILPDHANDDFAYWNNLVPGDTSATMWNKYVSYDRLPAVVDPPSGFVRNSNDPPWFGTYPQTLDPAKYPAYVAVRGPMSFRAQMSAHLLLSEPKITYDQLIQLKLSTRSLLADRMLPDLLAAAEKSDSPAVKQAVTVLKAWDHYDNNDSRGALLFETWASKFMGPAFSSYANFAVPWSFNDPINTPSGLKDPAGAVHMLELAAAETIQKYGTIDRPYGEVSRFHIGDVNLPGNGGFGNTGIFRTISWGPMENGQRKAIFGDTWVSVVEFSTPIKAMGLMSYGNSSQPGSKHMNDQLSYLSRKQLRTLWMTRPEIEKHLESKDTY